VILLASKVSCPQGSELPIIGKHLIKASSDDHVEVDIELSTWNLHVEESDLTPPSFPALLKFLNFYIRVESCPVISEAIKSCFPGSVSQNTCI
jgi:hypothetical protein